MSAEGGNSNERSGGDHYDHYGQPHTESWWSHRAGDAQPDPPTASAPSDDTPVDTRPTAATSKDPEWFGRSSTEAATSATTTSFDQEAEQASADSPFSSVGLLNDFSSFEASMDHALTSAAALLPLSLVPHPVTTAASTLSSISTTVTVPSPGPNSTGKSQVPWPSNGSKPSSYGDSQPPGPAFTHDHSTVRLTAAVVVPLVLVTIATMIVFVCLRRRRRRRFQAGIVGEKEMKTEPYNRIPNISHDVSPQIPPPTLSLSPPQPVMLSSISPAMNSAYYTGIDTSDAVSMPGTRHSTSGSGSYTEHGDEPPPPYRPRSVAPPISRDSSLRQVQPTALSHARLIEHESHLRPEGHNPFADPRDEDAVSDISGPVDGWHGGNNGERMSEVSEISYQDDPPTAVHHTI